MMPASLRKMHPVFTATGLQSRCSSIPRHPAIFRRSWPRVASPAARYTTRSLALPPSKMAAFSPRETVEREQRTRPSASRSRWSADVDGLYVLGLGTADDLEQRCGVAGELGGPDAGDARQRLARTRARVG